jgi:hypothetical protein
MMKFFASVFGSSETKLRNYEEAVVEAVEANLPPTARHLIRRQLEEINLVQRHSQDKEVNLYRMRGRKVEPPVEFRFPNDAEELHLARVRLESLESAEEVVADAWLVRGILFSITFGRSPKSVPLNRHRIKSCELFVDVMRPVIERPETQVPPPAEGSSRLIQLRQSGELSDVRAPAGPEELDRFRRAWGRHLPADYAALLQEANGFRFRGWECFGTRVRQVATEDKNVLVLAEHLTRGQLCAVEEEGANRVYLHDSESDGLTKQGHTFMEALLAASRDDAGGPEAQVS